MIAPRRILPYRAFAAVISHRLNKIAINNCDSTHEVILRLVSVAEAGDPCSRTDGAGHTTDWGDSISLRALAVCAIMFLPSPP